MEATLTLKAKDEASAAVKRLGGSIKGLSAPLKSVAGGLANMLRGLKGSADQAGQTGGRLRALSSGLLQVTSGAARLASGLGRMAASAVKAGLALAKYLGRAVIGRIISDLKTLGKAAADLGRSLGNLARTAAATFTKLTATTAAFGYAFKRVFIDLAADVEAQGLRLTNALGSKFLGDQALKQVRKFSASTGRELADATAAFAALAESGIKPTEAHLTALADMAAKKNKTMAETGEAFRRALKGDVGALEEWGVKSEAVGKHVLYQYKDQSGKLIRLAARADRPEALAKLLSQIAQDRAAGAEEERGKTFQGLLGKLTAKWAEFRAAIMDGGAFQFFKDHLAQLVKWVDSLDLPALAKDLGSRLTTALYRVKDALKSGWAWFQKWRPEIIKLAEKLGGFKTILAGLAAVMAGPLVAALGTALKSVLLFSRALALTPVGLLVSAGVALAALMKKAGALEPFVAGLKEGFKGFGEAIGPALTGLLEALGQAFEPIAAALKNINDGLGPEGWQEMGRAVAELTTGALKTLIEMLTKIVNLVDRVGKGIGTVVGYAAVGDVNAQDQAAAQGNLTVQKLSRQAKEGTVSRDDIAKAQRELATNQWKAQNPLKAKLGFKPKEKDLPPVAAASSKPLPSDIKNPEAITTPLGGKLDSANQILAQPKIVGNPEAISGPITVALAAVQAQLAAQLNKPQKLDVTVHLTGAVSGANVSAKVSTSTPGAAISDKRAQSMGQGGVTL